MSASWATPPPSTTSSVRRRTSASPSGPSGFPGTAPTSALERLGLTGRLRTTPAGRLSAGQRRRVALAALLARRPALWLLDEPHAGLDAAARALLGELIGEAVVRRRDACCSRRTSRSSRSRWPTASCPWRAAASRARSRAAAAPRSPRCPPPSRTRRAGTMGASHVA